jgi:hypothetical protein
MRPLQSSRSILLMLPSFILNLATLICKPRVRAPVCVFLNTYRPYFSPSALQRSSPRLWVAPRPRGDGFQAHHRAVGKS